MKGEPPAFPFSKGLRVFGKSALWEGELLMSPIFARPADLPISRPADHFGLAGASPSRNFFVQH